MKKIGKKDQPPLSVRLIRAKLADLMNQGDPESPGSKIGDAVGIYAYFDFDGEPIYVGQTSSAFRDRVGRHMNGQRSDAVAKFILDPFEVADVEMWSVSGVKGAVDPENDTKPLSVSQKRRMLEPFEYSVYSILERQSMFRAVLNEGVIKPSALVVPPVSVRGRIVPDELWEERKHSDVRIARRASTISRLSQMISEREVSGGMRRTLLLQAKRLAWLADDRIREIGAQLPDDEDRLIDED